ncbi:hypothetical protein HYV57_03450 [Candidatus Peregrinibacteria bacterium]|nr:hypothetical protein [Candidatus Peregrinibacteria bacterium]
MADDKITISDAVKQLQEWFDKKEYEKVILGSKEVLNIDSNNEIARNLLKKSEEMKKTKENDIQFPDFSNKDDSAEKIDTSKMSEDLQTPPQEKELTFPTDSTENIEMLKDKETWKDGLINNHGGIGDVMGYLIRKIATIIVVFAILGGIGYGAFAGYQYYQEKKASTEKNENTKNIEETTTKNDDELSKKNEQRQKDLETLKTSLEKYYENTNEFPAVENVEKELIEGGYITSIPLDPMHGEKDRYNKPYGYIYAVYENEKGNNQEYIISAKFENPNQIDSPWSPNDTSKHEDFRDLTKSNVKILQTYPLSDTAKNPPEPKTTPDDTLNVPSNNNTSQNNNNPLNDNTLPNNDNLPNINNPPNDDIPQNNVPTRKKVRRTTMIKKAHISLFITTFYNHV